jgi:AbiV family abortive infection protein
VPEGGFLQPVGNLTLPQIQEACEAAYGNAVALLEEAAILRSHERCARALYLAHVACEELGKLPILCALAVSVHMGHEIDWKRIDRALRSHEAKFKQVLFEDSLHVPGDWAAGLEAYEKDLELLRAYLDVKNSCLYSFNLDGSFFQPNVEVPCDHFDSFEGLAHNRLAAFEAAYMNLLRQSGSFEALFSGPWAARADEFLERLTSDETAAVFDEYQRTGDISKIEELFEDIFRKPE